MILWTLHPQNHPIIPTTGQSPGQGERSGQDVRPVKPFLPGLGGQLGSKAGPMVEAEAHWDEQRD